MINEMLDGLSARFLIASPRRRVAYALGGSLAYLGLVFALTVGTMALARWHAGLPIHW